MGFGASFSHAQAGRLYFFPSVVWVSFPGDFVVQDGLLFSPRLLAVSTFTFWGCCRLVWSRFGHDRAKNNAGIVFLVQAVNRLCDCVYAVVGLQTVLGAGLGDWFS